MFTRLVDLRVLERKNSDLRKIVDLSAAGEKNKDISQSFRRNATEMVILELQFVI